jgi:hypothetical protein
MLDRPAQLCHLSARQSPPVALVFRALCRYRACRQQVTRAATGLVPQGGSALAAQPALDPLPTKAEFFAMSTGKSELLAFLTISIGTLIGLFALHFGYTTFLDRRYHAELAEGGAAPSLVAARAEQKQKLDSGRIPIEQAMKDLGTKGRDAFASVKPIPSTDLSAVSGWVRHPAFQSVVAHPIRAPRSVEPLQAAPTGAEGATGETQGPTNPTNPTNPTTNPTTHAPH